MKQKTELATMCIVDQNAPSSAPLETAIRRFFAKRSIEAATAVSLVALTSFSQAWALSVGELNVTSSLGQPLRAWVEIATAPGETLNTRCMRLSSPTGAGMPGISGLEMTATITSTTTTLRFAGKSSLREPMSEIVFSIDCNGAPSLTRSFLVMLDPPSAFDSAPLTATARQASTESATEVAAVAARPRRAVRQNRPTRGSVAPGSAYVVQPGDVLSVIAARVEGRPDYSVWPIAQRIYETNPGAFEGRDPNTLRVGATIQIPRLTGRLAVDGSSRYRRGVAAGSRAAARNTAGVTSAASREAALAARSVESLRPEVDALASEPEMTRAATRPVSLQPAVVSDMAYTRRLSGLSMDRLRQRRTSEVFVEPSAVVDPVEAPSVTAELVAAPIAATTPAAAPQVRVITTQRHWTLDLLWLVGGLALGGLATMYGMRRWLQKQRVEQEREISRSKRHESRLEESRKTRSTPDTPSIVVHEELRRVDLTATLPVMDTIGSVEEILAASTASAQTELTEDELTTYGPSPLAQDAEPTLSVDALESDGELDFDAFDAPNEDDLELLAQDYAQSTGDVRNLLPGDSKSFEDTMAIMLTPKQLEIDDDGTELIEPSLDLELPQGDTDDTELALQQLEHQVSEELNDELTEAAIKLNANLLLLDHAFGDEAPDDLTAQAEQLILETADQDADDDPTSVIQTKDSEEFYHLEASTIRKVPELAFEQELEDDESRILSFRKQN